MTDHRNRILVGIVPGQPPAVVTMAARFARRFDAELVCAFVDAARYPIEELPDGTVVSLAIDPDSADDSAEELAGELKAAIGTALEKCPVDWSVRTLVGGPAEELGRLAAELDAAMIVVGTREPGLRGTFREFLNGSVAAQLSHRQHRPVVVVPLNPVGAEGDVPWIDEEA